WPGAPARTITAGGPIAISPSRGIAGLAAHRRDHLARTRPRRLSQHTKFRSHTYGQTRQAAGKRATSGAAITPKRSFTGDAGADRRRPGAPRTACTGSAAL